MKRYLWPVLSMILVLGVQGNYPSSLTIMGAKPDLVLVVLIAYSVVQDPVFGASMGFIAGLLQGAAVGMGVGSFLATRTITGFLAGLVPTRVFSENPIVPTLSAVWLTLVCEILFILGNPRPSFWAAFHTIIGECIYNAIFTVILYYILRSSDTRRKMRLVNARL